MYVKNIILDGFKSYAKNTIVGPFDECFNAITGLNGTGKSNILDAICFVLGISSLSTVRAARLEDLISKAKRDGEPINSASVAIIFDNTDKSPGSCPIGWEKRDQIVVSRILEYKRDSKEIISKYSLNGTLCPKNVIVDLFESIRLDVNNPNFMIMQGRITKVVNMKPKELLQMIEDTVGATIYQHKRDKTVSALENFKRQLAVLDSLREDTIKPSYEIQKAAAKDVEEYNSLAANLKRVDTSYAVANYLASRKKYKELDYANIKLSLEENADSLEIENQQSDIKTFKSKQQQLKQDAKEKVNVPAVEKEMSHLGKKFAGDEAKLSSVRLNKTEALERLVKAQVEHNEELKRIEDFKVTQKTLIEDFEKCNSSIEYAQRMVDEATEKESRIGYGTIIDEDGKTINIQEKITCVEQAIRDLKGPNDILKKELTSELKIIRDKEVTLKNTPLDEQVVMDHAKAASEVQRLTAVLRQNNINPSELSGLENSLYETNTSIHNIDSQEDRFYSRNQYLRFTYRVPHANFDARRIHGQVYELFSVKDFKTYGVALEVASGGYFTQVVVDSPDTSSYLINHGNLQWRTTFIPLSAIHDRPTGLKQSTLDKKVGKDNAVLGIDQVEYHHKYRTLMGMVFGKTVICRNLEVAKIVAYDVGHRAVTLEGDVVDPGGTMQGGTRRNAGQLLETCQSLRNLKLQRTQLQENLVSLKHKIDLCHKNAGLIRQHESAERRLKTCAELLALTDRSTLEEELRTLKTVYGKRIATANSVDAEIVEKLKEEKSLKQKQKMEAQLVEKSRKAVAADLKRWKREFELATKQKASKQIQYKEIEIELKAKDAVLAEFQKDIDEAKQNDEECKVVLKHKEDEFIKIVEEYNSKMKSHEAAIKASKSFDRKIEQIGEDISKAEQKIHNLEISKMKRSAKIKHALDEFNYVSSSIDNFVVGYPAIQFADDMEPLSNRPVHILEKELTNLKAKSETMHSTLNYRAAEALPKTKVGMEECEMMKKAMTRNQNYLVEIVKRLDRHKMNLVENAHVRINKEFDFMMSTLLPNSHAKLVPINPKNIAEGVVIHVCLGGVWKESLTELSGGQRSLVALSLVLSLCMFNPAPFYILDEIDSALDLNHTANIGYLIRTKFSNVQFICVSLKDGMYNNANAIFTTYFEDGTSKVKVSMKPSKVRGIGSSNSRR